MNVRVCVLCAVSCGVLACATPEKAPRPALVEPQPSLPDEEPQVRETLALFLTARWAFDYDAVVDFVTPNDAAEPWQDPLEQRLGNVRHAELWIEHEWSIIDIVVDGDEATARVDVVGPSLDDLMYFSNVTSVGMIRATVRWLRDPDKRQAELVSLQPPRVVRTVTYRLRKLDAQWLVFMDWPSARAMEEAKDPKARQLLFREFEGSEKELHARPPPPDERTQKLVEAVEVAERAIYDGDLVRARELYDALLVSDTIVPDFLAARRDSLDELHKNQLAKLAAADLEVGAIRQVDGRSEVRVKNHGRDLRRFRLVIEYVDEDGERTYRSLIESKLMNGQSRAVVIHPRRRRRVQSVRLVDVGFLDREFSKQFDVPTDATFRMRLGDLRTNGAARSSGRRIAAVFEAHLDQFDACPWPADADPVDIWVEVETPPEPTVARALIPRDSKLGDCLSKVAAGLRYPDAERNRSVVRVYPETHWWRAR